MVKLRMRRKLRRGVGRPRPRSCLFGRLSLPGSVRAAGVAEMGCLGGVPPGAHRRPCDYSLDDVRSAAADSPAGVRLG